MNLFMKQFKCHDMITFQQNLSLQSQNELIHGCNRPSIATNLLELLVVLCLRGVVHAAGVPLGVPRAPQVQEVRPDDGGANQ